MHRPSIVFIANRLEFFVSHRLSLLKKAEELGIQTKLIVGRSDKKSQGYRSVLEIEKLKHRIPNFKECSFSSQRLVFFSGLIGLAQTILELKKIKPTTVHCISAVGIVFGGLAARFCRVPALVVAFSGMGYLFTGDNRRSLKKMALQFVYKLVMKIVVAHKNKKIIVQNIDDERLVKELWNISPDEIVLIPGSGVELAQFRSVSVESKESIVLFPGRLLADKGVREFVEAAKLIHLKAPEWRFVIAGEPDYSNPTAIREDEINSWIKLPFLDIRGFVPEMASLYSSAAIVCLPSFREGFPKALQEASAAKCAVVTTDVVGCRDAIVPGVTGDLTIVKNVNDLASVLLNLINDKKRRERYGLEGRKHAESKFSVDRIASMTFDVYGQLVNFGH